MKMVCLGEVAEIVRAGVPPEKIVAGTPYLGLEHIESGGRIISSEPVANGQLASSKFQFGPEHLLYGKLRPYLAKIALPDFSGICSTDILPVKAGPDLDKRYLAYFLRQPKMVDFANSRSSGANLPRLSPKTLADFQIPLPRLPEQLRIAEILDQAAALRRLRCQSLSRLSELGDAIFNELFYGSGEIKETASLGDVAELRRGPFGGALKKEIFVESGYQIYEQSHAIGGSSVRGRYFITLAKFQEMKAFQILPNDLIISCSGTMGQIHLIPHDAPKGIINQALLRVRAKSDKIKPEILEIFLSSGAIKRFLSVFARGSGLQNFPPISDVKEIRVPILKSEMQEAILQMREELHRRIRKTELALQKTDSLFLSLQHRAFRGEL